MAVNPINQPTPLMQAGSDLSEIYKFLHKSSSWIQFLSLAKPHITHLQDLTRSRLFSASLSQEMFALCNVILSMPTNPSSTAYFAIGYNIGDILGEIDSDKTNTSKKSPVREALIDIQDIYNLFNALQPNNKETFDKFFKSAEPYLKDLYALGHSGGFSEQLKSDLMYVHTYFTKLSQITPNTGQLADCGYMLGYLYGFLDNI